jgi:D-glycero-D-manno-heptose 1,7-bisphosphate phosphatase
VRKPIFLDRDGVLNVDVSPYVSRLELFQVFPWTVDSLVKLDRAGYDIYVVSNQQGVALGITPEEELGKMNEHMQAMLRPHGFEIKKFYYCLARDEENHPWRKPNCGMLTSAGEEFGFDPAGAFMIGDKDTDLIAGASAGCRPLLLLSGVTPDTGDWEHWDVKPEAVFPTLAEAADYVVRTE